MPLPDGAPAPESDRRVESHWRRIARPIIRQICEKLDGKQRDQALHDAYPFGVRKYHPYRIWCDEVRMWKGMKPFDRRRGRDFHVALPDPRQENLFEGPCAG